jgi:hypothetical protein
MTCFPMGVALRDHISQGSWLASTCESPQHKHGAAIRVEMASVGVEVQTIYMMTRKCVVSCCGTITCPHSSDLEDDVCL